MFFFALEPDSSGRPITCPHCNKKSNVDANWSTRYGEPIPGRREVECPHCNKVFKIEIKINATYRVI